jgi:hypothetical protein
MSYGFVYCWNNVTNGKKYIGSHFGNIHDSYIGSGIYFKRAYLKNPKDFNRDILYVGARYKEVEEDLLIKNNAQSNSKFYNLKNSSVGGWSHLTEESKKKRLLNMSKTKKGKYPEWLKYDKSGKNNPMFGKQQSIETKNKISKKLTGKSNADKKVIELTENKLFNSVTECAKHFGVTQPTMSILIRNKKINRGNCKGKIFNYA